MSHSTSSERSGGGSDSVAASPRAERAEANFDRADLYKSYDSTVNSGGRGTQVASNESFPSHADYSFYNSSAYGTAVGTDAAKAGPGTGVGDGTISAAPPTDNTNGGGDSRFAAPNYYNDYKQDASKFAYGTALTDGQSAEGKEKLERLTAEMYKTGGDKLLQGLANDMNKDALNKFGDAAFADSPKAFDDSVAKVSATPNKDGTTQVQWDFAQPNSSQAKSVIFQLPKNIPADGYQQVFPDSTKDTYVR